MTAERITAPHVQKALDEHLQKHELKIDPKLHNLQVTIFGERGQGGLSDDIEKVKDHLSVLDGHEGRIIRLETGTVERVERIGTLRRDVDKLCSEVEDNEKWRNDVNVILKSSTDAISFGKWILGILGVSIVGLIWSLITGQASIIFK